MFEQNGFDAYQHTALEARAASADPHQLVLMLIDGLQDELARVAGHLQAGRLDRKGKSIAKCLDILGGLDTALDIEKGGEVALQLRQLYDFCGRQLFEVSLNNDPAGLVVVEQIIGNLREGWQSLAA